MTPDRRTADLPLARRVAESSGCAAMSLRHDPNAPVGVYMAVGFPGPLVACEGCIGWLRDMGGDVTLLRDGERATDPQPLHRRLLRRPASPGTDEARAPRQSPEASDASPLPPRPVPHAGRGIFRRRVAA